MSTSPPNRPGQPTGPQPSGSGLGGIRGRLAAAGLVRPASGGLLAGVLAGLAARFGVSPWVARGLFLVSMLLPGPQFVLYAVLWIAMPRGPLPLVSSSPNAPRAG
jgi:phage shock protein C